ncbi:MAG: proP7 [Rickettsiaceae bacterium]|jgi:MHS family proline/betaine transporter-like MFS transporter|nr:proP7 [Rickettsiaceae bacterium]
MQQRNKVLFSAISGNILEYYDFTVYSIFSIIIGKTFFPETSEYLQNLLSLAVFAIGFITRPIGGIIFGYIGDHFGRRIALICSMLGMTIPTFAIGLIPSFNDIGYLAPILLIIMRLFQGLCISGEGAGAAIFVLEHLHNFRPGLITGFVHGSNIAGTLMASFIGLLVENYLSKYYEDAWRFAFLLGGFLGLIGFYLRLWVNETPIFEKMASSKKVLRAPFRSVLQTAYPLLLLTFVVGGAASSIVYIVKTYINNFYNAVMHLDNTASLLYLSFTSIVMMIAMPISGALSDRFGKVRVIFTSGILIFCLALPVLYIMSSPNQALQIMALAALGTLAGLISGTAYIFVISLFTPEQRYTGVGFSYNLGVAVFGGTSPMIARWLVEKTHLLYSPAFYLIFTSLMLLTMLRYYVRNNIISSDM